MLEFSFNYEGTSSTKMHKVFCEPQRHIGTESHRDFFEPLLLKEHKGDNSYLLVERVETITV